MRLRLSAQVLRYTLAILLGLSIGGTSAILSAALIPDKNGVIHGCYDRRKGDLRVVSDASDCKDGEIAIYWNQRGPVGPTGATGAKGPTGATGPTGPSGATGTSGASGAAGPAGPAGPSGAPGAGGATGPTGPAGQGISSLNSLNGLPCGAANTGTTRVVYAAEGAVSIFCDAPPEETPQPVYTGVSVAGNLATVSFNRDVCRAMFWSATNWEVTVNGVAAAYEDIGDGFPLCTAAADNGVTTANLTLINSPAPGSTVAVTLTVSGGLAIRDQAGNFASAPQTRIATATTAETTPPTIASATGEAGATIVTLAFSEPVYCIAFSFDSTDIVITDNNPATTDPTATAPGPNACAATQATADTSFSVQFSTPFLPGATYTVVLFPETNEIQDVFGNDLVSPSTVTFSTGAADIGAPTLTDTRLLQNLQTTDFGETGDAFDVTFSEAMNASGSNPGINLQDADGTTNFLLICGVNSSCSWNTAGTTLTVTMTTHWLGTGGTTPGLQVPSTITTLNGVTDLAGNLPNLSGSADRVIDNEFLTGPFAPPTVTDARMLSNVVTTDFGEPGDAFRAIFSAAMISSPNAGILIQDQDGSVTFLSCGASVACTWDTSATTLTVTVSTFALPFVPGGTPGMQIPMRIAMLGGIIDSNGSVPDLAGSLDTLIDTE